VRERAAAMLERVTAEARGVLPEADALFVRAALETCLTFRDDRIENDHDSRLLHPARTLRVLIADAGCRSADALAAAAFVDTVDADLVPKFGSGAPQQGRFDAAREILVNVPVPGTDSDDLRERLVTAPVDAAVVAIAERLDQVRHLHLRPELPWEEHYAQVREVYFPVARRLAPGLARRLHRWADAFERRLLLRRPPDLQ
jgi:hypothetical protein